MGKESRKGRTDIRASHRRKKGRKIKEGRDDEGGKERKEK
jgi:hypothetical protein